MRVVDVEDCTALFVFMVDACRTEDSGSLEEELIKRASHSHLLFKENDTAFYYRLDESIMPKVHYASIKPFKRKKDEGNTWLSIVKHNTGVCP